MHPPIPIAHAPFQGGVQAKPLGEPLAQVRGQLGALVAFQGEEPIGENHAEGCRRKQEQGGRPGRQAARGVKAFFVLQQPVALSQGGGEQKQRQPEQQQSGQIKPGRHQGDGHGHQQRQPCQAESGKPAFPSHQKPAEKE